MIHMPPKPVRPQAEQVILHAFRILFSNPQIEHLRHHLQRQLVLADMHQAIGEFAALHQVVLVGKMFAGMFHPVFELVGYRPRLDFARDVFVEQPDEVVVDSDLGLMESIHVGEIE